MGNGKTEPTGHRKESRPLNADERALLEWLVVNGNSNARQYSSQIGSAHVVGRCTCGCPTIDLAVGDSEEATVGPSQIIADFEGVTPDGVEVGVILHVRQGFLSELEVYPMYEAAPFSLPTIESLKNL